METEKQRKKREFYIKILTDRFGLNGNEPMILNELAIKYGCSRQWLQQLEISAIQDLQRSGIGHPFFLEFLKEELRDW